MNELLTYFNDKRMLSLIEENEDRRQQEGNFFREQNLFRWTSII
jgi:hypothetical protein